MQADTRQDHAEDGNQAQAWLREALKDGPMPAADVLSQGTANGFTNKVIRNAFHDLRGKRKKADFRGGWIWWLPAPGEDSSSPTGESWESSASSQKHGESSATSSDDKPQDSQRFHEDSQDSQDSGEWGIVA